MYYLVCLGDDAQSHASNLFKSSTHCVKLPWQTDDPRELDSWSNSEIWMMEANHLRSFTKLSRQILLSQGNGAVKEHGCKCYSRPTFLYLLLSFQLI